MAGASTVARPYAKAIFELARDAKALADWHNALEVLAFIAEEPSVVKLLNSPEFGPSDHVELFLDVLSDSKVNVDTEIMQNLIAVLADNRRLGTLMEIFIQYARLRELFEKTIEVAVTSFAPLTDAQREQIVQRLSAKLQRQVQLKEMIDKDLRGGAIIRAGHLVYDASVGTQVNNLSSALTA